ncbi:MAG: cytochrome b [Maritimibacter sp.]
MTTATQTYARKHAWIHWIMAVLILLMLLVGQKFGTQMPEADRIFSLSAHSSLGLIVVLLLVVRIAMRATGASQKPTLPISPMLQRIATGAQYALYALMIFVPVTGFLAARVHPLPVSPFGITNISTPNLMSYETLRPLHEFGTKALIVVVALHIAGALFHKFIKRDGVMRAMNPFAKRA